MYRYKMIYEYGGCYKTIYFTDISNIYEIRDIMNEIDFIIFEQDKPKIGKDILIRTNKIISIEVLKEVKHEPMTIDDVD